MVTNEGRLVLYTNVMCAWKVFFGWKDSIQFSQRKNELVIKPSVAAFFGSLKRELIGDHCETWLERQARETDFDGAYGMLLAAPVVIHRRWNYVTANQEVTKSLNIFNILCNLVLVHSRSKRRSVSGPNNNSSQKNNHGQTLALGHGLGSSFCERRQGLRSRQPNLSLETPHKLRLWRRGWGAECRLWSPPQGFDIPRPQPQGQHGADWFWSNKVTIKISRGSNRY